MERISGQQIADALIENDDLRRLVQSAGVLPPYRDWKMIRRAAARMPEFIPPIREDEIDFESIEIFPQRSAQWKWIANLMRSPYEGHDTGFDTRPMLDFYYVADRKVPFSQRTVMGQGDKIWHVGDPGRAMRDRMRPSMRKFMWRLQKIAKFKRGMERW